MEWLIELKDVLVFMAPAIVMCVILVAICGYVGIHVIMREVIFIDIALAQVAAVGASLGMFMGLELNDPLTYVVSMVTTVAAALLLSSTRRLGSLVPQEAFIGILYATGAAAVLLVGDRLPHGNEHVHDLMMGHLLWVNWKEVGLHFLVYGGLGIVFFFCHGRLAEISGAGRCAGEKTSHVVFWDFIFYALLGVLVTFAVRVAGVLLVFGFLIVPAVIGSLLAKSFATRMLLAWGAGVGVSLAGSYLSYAFDFPTGGTVVVTLGLSLLAVAAVKTFQLRAKEKRAGPEQCTP